MALKLCDDGCLNDLSFAVEVVADRRPSSRQTSKMMLHIIDAQNARSDIQDDIQKSGVMCMTGQNLTWSFISRSLQRHGNFCTFGLRIFLQSTSWRLTESGCREVGAMVYFGGDNL